MVLSLDWYNGRAVKRVEKLKASGKWQIVLEGKIRIICLDENYEMPDKVDLVGKHLQLVTLSSTETRLTFGTSEAPATTQVHLPPTGWAVSDPVHTSGKLVRADQAEVPAAEETRPDEPIERIAEAPESDSNATEGEGEG